MFTFERQKRVPAPKKAVRIVINPLKRREIARRKAAAEKLKGIWADKDDSFFEKR